LELAESALHSAAASFDGVEFYPDLATKAAVLCTRIVKNHPLPDGNKRVGFVDMIEFCLRDGLTWTPPPGDEDGETSARVILKLAAGPGDEDAVAALAAWITERTAS
jgi:death-on-curing protein